MWGQSDVGDMTLCAPYIMCASWSGVCAVYDVGGWLRVAPVTGLEHCVGHMTWIYGLFETGPKSIVQGQSSPGATYSICPSSSPARCELPAPEQLPHHMQPTQASAPRCTQG